MKIAYIKKNFRADTLRFIHVVNGVIREYQRRGYRLTLRQLYYQIVARDLFPEERRWSYNRSRQKWYRNPNGTKNADPNYKWMGGIINDARLAGLIDWDAIEDRTRNLAYWTDWRSPREIVQAARDSYHVDHWEGQRYRPEVWVEKEALAGVIQRACRPLDVDFICCRGYMSQSEMWAAGQRFEEYFFDRGQEPVLIHLGDHDPSGMDMTRDTIDRLEMFMGGLEVKRIALNIEQVWEYDPPPDPAKTTDSRFKEYEAEYGDESWELDALDPDVLVELITNAIKELRDDDLYQKVIEREKEERALIGTAVELMPAEDEEE